VSRCYVPDAVRRWFWSPRAYNDKTRLMICWPLTQIIGGTRPNAVLADPMKSVDWRSRNAKSKGRVSAEQLAEVRAKIRALIG
jgi:mRNA interferase MazF